MARRYQVTFSAVTVSAAQDLVQIVGPSAGKIMIIRRAFVFCPDTTLATGQDLSLRARYLPATVTIGSGGTTGITPSKNDQGDATCSSTTCATNNTTQATTNGTAVIIFSGGCHLYAGADLPFDCTVNPSTAFVFELLGAPSGTVKLSGGVVLDELG